MGERLAASWRDEARDPTRAELVDMLFRRHYPALLRLAVVMLGNREAAEDAVQDAFVAVHRHWPSLRDPEAAEAYLRSAVLNRCRSWVRRQVTQRAPRPLLLVRNVQESPEASVVDRDENQLAMRAALPEAGVMNVQTPSGQAICGFDASEGWVLEQVLPTNNEYLAGLEISESEVADLRPPPNSVYLQGDWMAQGGGHVLELAPDGSYYIAEGSGDFVDRGRWALDAESAQLRLLSDSTSSTCDQGDRLVMSGLGYVYVDGTAFIRATVDENTCGAAWTPPVWIMVPDVHI